MREEVSTSRGLKGAWPPHRGEPAPYLTSSPLQRSLLRTALKTTDSIHIIQSLNENHKIASLLISKSVCRLMRGARIRRRKPHRFLTTCQTPSRPISGRSTSGGGGGGVRGVGDRLQASLLRHCARQLVPQELASSLFRAACFLVPLLVQIPEKDGLAWDKRNFPESKEILTSAICWSSL